MTFPFCRNLLDFFFISLFLKFTRIEDEMSVKMLKTLNILDEVKTEVMFKSTPLCFSIKLTFGRYHPMEVSEHKPVGFGFFFWCKMNQNFSMACCINTITKN